MQAIAPVAYRDDAFVPPEVDDLNIYELQVAGFNQDFNGVIRQLDDLDDPEDLGVDVLELMPVTNVPEKVERGYTPLGYFARTIGSAGLQA